MRPYEERRDIDGELWVRGGQVEEMGFGDLWIRAIYLGAHLDGLIITLPDGLIDEIPAAQPQFGD